MCDVLVLQLFTRDEKHETDDEVLSASIAAAQKTGAPEDEEDDCAS